MDQRIRIRRYDLDHQLSIWEIMGLTNKGKPTDGLMDPVAITPSISVTSTWIHFFFFLFFFFWVFERCRLLPLISTDPFFTSSLCMIIDPSFSLTASIAGFSASCSCGSCGSGFASSFISLVSDCFGVDKPSVIASFITRHQLRIFHSLTDSRCSLPASI